MGCRKSRRKCDVLGDKAVTPKTHHWPGWVWVLLLLAITPHADRHANGSLNSVCVQSAGRPNMVSDTRQIYATPRLNSLQPYAARAKGQLAWKQDYNSSRIPGNVRSLLIQSDQRLVIDYGKVFFVVDLERKTVMGSQWKDGNSFPVLDAGGDLYYCESNLLFRQKVDRFGVIPEESCFLPGLAPASEVLILVPGGETVLFGVQSSGTPNDDRPVFGILEKEFASLRDRWMVQFAGVVVRPPVSSNGTAAVASGRSLCLVGPGGVKGPEIELPVRASQCSIGLDDRVYVAGTGDSGSMVLAFDPDGAGLWECTLAMSAIVQPPLVDAGSAVILVARDEIVTVVDGEERWRFTLPSREGIVPAASLSNDGSLLVAAGRKVICLSPAGEVAWVYEHGREEVFSVPPVIDSRGVVYAASDVSIVAIK
jgi:hypothetical protein